MLACMHQVVQNVKIRHSSLRSRPALQLLDSLRSSTAARYVVGCDQLGASRSYGLPGTRYCCCNYAGRAEPSRWAAASCGGLDVETKS